MTRGIARAYASIRKSENVFPSNVGNERVLARLDCDFLVFTGFLSGAVFWFLCKALGSSI